MSQQGVVFSVVRALAKACLTPLFATLLALCAVCPAARAEPAAAAGSPEASPSPPPEVAQLRAKIELAEGQRLPSERIVTAVVENGRTKMRTSVRSGTNVRDTLEDGPFVTAYGTFEGQRWHQNANGMTVLDQPRHGGEANERRTLALRHVTAPLVADVIADVDPKGDGTKTYVDPATSRIVRVEVVTPTETTVKTYDDFRNTAGRTQAWHQHSADGQPDDERDERVVSIATAGISAADVAIAPPRRALVAFPSGVTTARLPVQLDGNQQFIVRVTVGSRGLDFLLDTGASRIVLDRDVATSLGLKLYANGSNASNAGRYAQSVALVPEMHVGPLAMKNVAVSVVPSLQFASPNAPVRVVGLLGFDFIASLALSFDYEGAAVTAVDYDSFKAPSDPMTVALPIRVGDQGPETDVSIDGRLGERFKIDTGGAGGVMITDVFTRRYPGITRGFRSRGGQIRLTGVGGDFAATLYTEPNLRLGPTTFENFSALVIGSDRLYAGGGFDGVIGPEILQYFTMTTDYADSTLYLTPNKLGRKSMKSGS